MRGGACFWYKMGGGVESGLSPRSGNLANERAKQASESPPQLSKYREVVEQAPQWR